MIDVVVCAYKSGLTIEGCLRAILEDSDVASLTVIDNSRDATTRLVCGSLKDQRLSYEGSDNVGYAAACNRGLSAGEADFVAVVNPDVTLTMALSSLTAVVDVDFDGALTGLLLDCRGHHNCRRQVTPLRELLASLIGASRAYRLRPRQDDASRLVAVPQIDGSLLVMSRGTFMANNGFDERYELYYEDVDLCRVLNYRGGCWLLPVGVGRHDRGTSYRQVQPVAYVVLRLSRLRFLRKWYGWPGAGIDVLASCAEWGVRSLLSLSEGQTARNRALLLTLRDACLPRRRTKLLANPGRRND